MSNRGKGSGQPGHNASAPANTRPSAAKVTAPSKPASTQNTPQKPQSNTSSKSTSKKKDKAPAASPQKSGWFFSKLWGGGPKKAVYKPAVKETYIDPKTGEKKVRHKVNLSQFEVKQKWNPELGKYEFYDANGNVIEDSEPEEDEDEDLPAMPRSRRPRSKINTQTSAPKVPASRPIATMKSTSNPMSSATSRVQEEAKENMSRPTSSSLDLTESMEEKGIEHLQREIRKLKEENLSLKQQLESSSNPNVAVHGSLSGGMVSKQVIDRLDQNQRILRYLHQWADQLPAVMNRNSLEMLSEFDLKPRPAASGGSGLFGASLFHLMLIMVLTVLLVFWDTTMAGNTMDDGMNLIDDASIEFAYSLYIMSMGYVPDEMWQHTEVAVGYGQMMMNQTATFTQNLVSKIT